MDPFASDDLVLAFALLQAVVALLVIRLLDVYEREPIGIVALMFAWGAIGAAALASLGNEALQGELARDVEVVYGPMISAPVIEELAKGLALVIAFALSRWAGRRFGVFEFEGVTDGIVYGAAIGIGFAFTEDLYYFFREAQSSGVGDAFGVFVDRRDFFGPATLRHAIWTATFGAGLGLATVSRGLTAKVAWPLLGLVLAMAMHAINNGLVPVLLAIKYGFETTFEYLAIGVPTGLADRMDATAASAVDVLRVISWVYVVLFFGMLALGLRHQRRVIAGELAEERDAGRVNDDEYGLAVSPPRRMRRQIEQVRGGDLIGARATGERSRELAELAFARRRARRDPAQPRRRGSGSGHEPGRPPS